MRSSLSASPWHSKSNLHDVPLTLVSLSIMSCSRAREADDGVCGKGDTEREREREERKEREREREKERKRERERDSLR